MSAVTATILAGRADDHHPGIQPSHLLSLHENGRPSWTLTKHPPSKPGDRSVSIQWIPTVEHMLEDALLMLALHVVANEKLITLAEEYLLGILSQRKVELYRDIEDPAHREALYTECREISRDTFPMIVVSAFNGSSILSQLPVLERYRMDVEVCLPTYSRLFSAWNKATHVEGTL